MQRPGAKRGREHKVKLERINHQLQLLFIIKDLKDQARASLLIRPIDCWIGHLSLLKDTKTMNNFGIERVGGK